MMNYDSTCSVREICCNMIYPKLEWGEYATTYRNS